MLQSPEIFTVTSFKPQTVSFVGAQTSVKAPTEIHAYHSGDKVTFSIYIKGLKDSKPQDIKSYTISTYAKEKPGISLGNPNNNLKPIEVKVQDIISSTNVLDLLNNPPQLTVSVIRQDDTGKFNAATGSPFNLKLPDSRYIGNSSGKVQLISATNLLNYAPENACSTTGDKICGSNVLNISNCVTYKCWRFTKGSQVAKDCCRGLVKYFPDTNASSSSSGTSQLLPTCNKDTKQIECKSTNSVYVPYCNKRYIPDCLSQLNNSSGVSSSGGLSEVKPVCKPSVEGTSNSSSSSGLNEQVEAPTCIPLDKAAEMYCDEVTNLPYNLSFTPGDYINNFCNYISDPEKKKGCCEGAGAIYDKLTGEQNVSEDVNGIRSCLDFNADGGYCEDFNRSKTCVKESCYKEEYGSDKLKACCIKNDKEASETYQLLKDAQLSEDTGMIYNIVTFNDQAAQTPVKIQKSIDDLLAQNFELTLPNDPDIDSVVIRVACEDTIGKIYNAELNIVLIPSLAETTIAQEENKKGTCFQSTISSLKVNNGASITVNKDELVEIPLTITDPELDLNSVKITGLNSDFKTEELNKAPGYNFTLIKGIPKTPGKLTVTATAEDNCKPTKFTFDILVSDIPIPKEPEIITTATTNLVSVWLPTVPFIGVEFLKSIIKAPGMSYTKVKYDLPRAVVAGSKISLEIPSPANLTNINSSKLKLTWISSTNRIKILPSTIKQLPENKTKLITLIDKDEPEGIAKVVLSDITDIRNIIAQAEVNIMKPQVLTKINGMAFDKPIVENFIIKGDPGRPDDPLSLKIKITGKNFIGKKAKINNKKIIIQRKAGAGQLSRFTYAEFRNSNIAINKIQTEDNNSTLILKIKLPKNYKGSKEELFISTPLGQTFVEIDLSKTGNVKGRNNDKK